MKQTKVTWVQHVQSQRAGMAAALAMAIIGGIIGLHLSNAAPSPTSNRLPTLPLTDPAPWPAAADDHETHQEHEEALVNNTAANNAHGLFKASDGPCGELFEIRDSQGGLQGCTHGLDPMSGEEHIDDEDHVSNDAAGEPTPLPSDQLTSPNNIVCDGDGKAGKRVQALYVRTQSQASKYTAFNASFQEYAKRANMLILRTSLKNGGEARTIHYVTDSNCKVNVPEVVIPDSTQNGDYQTQFGSVIAALKNLGYNRTDRKYMVWIDSDYTADGACGVGSLYIDDRPGQDNPSNSGPTFGLTSKNCWGQGTEAHELLHNLGAVLDSAPHSDAAGHCTDAFDRMCRVVTVKPLNMVCDVSLQNLFDCNNDDFFNSGTIPSGSYLSTHWNTANSAFFVRGGSPDSRDIVKPFPPDFYSPHAGDIIKDRVSLIANTLDNVGISKVDFQFGNYLPDTVTKTLPYQDGTPSPTYYSVSYDLTTVPDGTYNVIVTAYDLDGNSNSTTIQLTLQNTNPVPPPPTTPPPTTPPPTTPPPTTPPPTTPPPVTGKTGDINGDNKINLTDLSILLSNWNKTGSNTADINKSGKVDLTDLSILLSNWGK